MTLNVETPLEVLITFACFGHQLMGDPGKVVYGTIFQGNLCNALASSLYVSASAKLRSGEASMCVHIN